jgi:hypothetical protein
MAAMKSIVFVVDVVVVVVNQMTGRDGAQPRVPEIRSI